MKQRECYMPVHGRTLTGWLAEEAAADMAADCRELIREAARIKEAMEQGDANASDAEKRLLLDQQILSYCSLIFVNEDGDEFPVRAYITKRQGLLVAAAKAKLLAGYERIKRVLH